MRIWGPESVTAGSAKPPVLLLLEPVVPAPASPLLEGLFVRESARNLQCDPLHNPADQLKTVKQMSRKSSEQPRVLGSSWSSRQRIGPTSSLTSTMTSPARFGLRKQRSASSSSPARMQEHAALQQGCVILHHHCMICDNACLSYQKIRASFFLTHPVSSRTSSAGCMYDAMQHLQGRISGRGLSPPVKRIPKTEADV